MNVLFARVSRRAAWVWIAGILALAPSHGAAQTRFTWPGGVDLSHYTTIEDCLALTGRMRDSLERSSAVWKDTLQVRPEEARAPLPGLLTETAQRCSAPFVASTAPLTDFAGLLQLYVMAARDTEAAALVERRLKSIGAKADAERAGVLDTTIQTYLGVGSPGRPAFAAQPARLAAAEPLVAQLAKLTAAASAETRLTAFERLATQAALAGDIARARRAAAGYVAVSSTLTSEERRQFQDGLRAYTMITYLSSTELLDSLAHGTAGYVALQRANWAKATGERPEAMLLNIGKPTQPVQADFWFRNDKPGVPRPTKGRVSLVAFLDQRCLQEGDVFNCWSGVAPLVRLAERFPDLEITLVANTFGYLSEAAPMPPAQEAEALKRWWLDDRGLPGALAVTNTSFWRLTQPDNRRVDRDVPNILNYQFFSRGRIRTAGATFLIDRDGIIVDMGDFLNPVNNAENRFALVIQALLQQPARTS
jgi:hypothetical protein